MSSKTTYANGYTFTVNENTGTTTVTGGLQDAKAGRDVRLQTRAGGELRQSTDQGGHLVAAQHNGPAISENLFAQDGHLNQGPYKTVEKAENRLISDSQQRASIQTERTAYVSNPNSGNGIRPDTFMVNDTITYADGKTQNVHLSFSNMSVAEQEQMNYDLDTKVPMENMPNPGDTLRESMSVQEYSQLMEETDAGLPNLRDEFDEHITNDNLQFAETENGGAANMNAVDCDASWDFDISRGDDVAISDNANWDFEAESDSSSEINGGIDGEIDGGISGGIDGEIDGGISGGIDDGIDEGIDGGIDDGIDGSPDDD